MKLGIPRTYPGWRSSNVRRALFQVHLWLGVALGIYLCVMSLSGAALPFRINLQRAEFPHLLTPSSPAVNVGAAEIVGNLRVAYARGDVVGGFVTWWRRVMRPAYVQSGAAAVRT